ncbi:MAG: peptidase M22, partial [Tissierellia bacterium]|nr:peptidase M22 [Tissierellia bacterium]
MDRYYIGIDTSAYTTSLAIIDDRDTIIADLRIGLTVGEGKRGLRQQEAIFQHMKNLPILVENMVEEVDVSEIEVVSCSSRPRTIKGSYMPVFMVGSGQALVLSKILGCKYEEFSHQEGHIGAGMLN